jgi:hypothetical protein
VGSAERYSGDVGAFGITGEREKARGKSRERSVRRMVPEGAGDRQRAGVIG